jgi:SNF2 family DNA or RNA helicase
VAGHEGREIRVSVLEAALEAFMPPDPDLDADGEHEGAEEGRARDRDVLDIETNIEEPSFVVERSPRHPQIAVELGIGDRVRSSPKAHQEEGFQWLVEAWTAGWPGVLLADDMGLGKTYQALAFLAWCRKAEETKSGKAAPILIVAPTALLKTWIFEAEQHLAPGVLGDRVEAFGVGLRDLKTPKGRGWTPETALDIARLRGAGWILTTYETLATYHRAFARVGYGVSVFDEMQRIKSPTTLNTHAAKAMSVDFVLGLTGTPVENRLEDIWCIMDRIAPGLLGDLKSFSGHYSDATEEQLLDLKNRLEGQHGAPPIMMRRLKEDILDGLPTKEIKTYQSPMPDRQANAYAQTVAAAQSLGGNRAVILEAIHRFRGISLHPELDAEIAFGDLAAFEAWSKDSARVSLTLGILDDIYARGEKALLFLEYKAAQRVMAAGLVARYRLPTEPMIINGDVPGAKRQPMVAEFQSRPPGFDLMILSPRAAGVGLTITAANHVIHLSRWWNPAVEDQCNDRVYRIGQDKAVTIHVPLAVHQTYGDRSFDLTLNALLERKRALSHGLLAPPESSADVGQLFAAVAGADGGQRDSGSGVF